GFVGNATGLDIPQGLGGEGHEVNGRWLATRVRRIIARHRQMTPRQNGLIAPVLIVPVELMDFVTRITSAVPFAEVEPGRSSTIETADVHGRDMVLFAFVLLEFVWVTKAWEVSIRLHRETSLTLKRCIVHVPW